ncbi:cellulose biosynthesis protein BcsO [Acerihabitans arboris]|uniref:Cellulose biosynthesis protein BcsO n=1 Tax=Acerihabitans arboris TaxID=2691583 RepID=A0A845SN40_9GAMM|nr:cellulose biosynthesis protein BcsO [Acerihabitans arboris]NDL64627.1 cellulose biosynthesis protein BcsO [Acerihabitans arboris]
MNNYDDIKRFKEKLNMESIDYKEIAESNPNITSHNWAIIKQVATADEPFHPLEQGRSTQPTPAPISEKEFSATPLGQQARTQQPRAVGHINQNISARYRPQATVQGDSFASPLMSAVSQALPATSPAMPSAEPAGEAPAGAALLNAIQREFAAPPKAVTPPRPQAPQPAATPLFEAATHVRPAPAAPRTTSPGQATANAMRFNSLFNRKAQQSATRPGRDMPLSLLLENIALCR